MPETTMVGHVVVSIIQIRELKLRNTTYLDQGHPLASRGYKQSFEPRQHSRSFAVGNEAQARSLGPHSENGKWLRSTGQVI